MGFIVIVPQGYNGTEPLLLTHHQGEQWLALSAHVCTCMSISVCVYVCFLLCRFVCFAKVRVTHKASSG